MPEQIRIIIVPGCGAKLYLKKGQKKVVHFAHYKSTCSLFTEGETEAHLKGKKLLAKWEEELGYDVQPEAYLSELRQRPDVLVKRQERNDLALEYQCAPITAKRLVERSNGYRSIGLNFFWILGQKYKLEKSLTNATAKFIRWNASLGFYLLFLDPINEKIEIDYAIQKADFLPVRYLRGYVRNLRELRDFFNRNHSWKMYRLSDVLREEQVRKLEARLHFSKGKIRKLQVACYVNRVDARELIWNLVCPHYYQPVYSEDSCYWKASLLLTLFSSEAFSLQGEFFKIKRENCYFMPFVSSADAILKEDISHVIKKARINTDKFGL